MKIGIVNDISLAVRVLSKFIHERTEHKVIWHAYNGKEAVERCAHETPDLILMDLVMPVMDGVKATKIIMERHPCAILIVTSSIKTNLSLVYEAMGVGALDVVRTPTIEEHQTFDTRNELLKKINTIETLLGYKLSKKGLNSTKEPQKKIFKSGTLPLLIMGASTGGPMSLAEIISKFPANIPFATIIIQHLDEEFTAGFSRWLGQQTEIKVQIAKEGDIPKAGHAYLSGQNKHLIMNANGAFAYDDEPSSNPYKPSIDVFFLSIAENWPGKFVAALLTGMGCDGARGLKKLRDIGWHTISESQESCVIYGMPKVALEINAVSVSLHLDKIAHEILKKTHELPRYFVRKS